MLQKNLGSFWFLKTQGKKFEKILETVPVLYHRFLFSSLYEEFPLILALILWEVITGTKIEHKWKLKIKLGTIDILGTI